MCKKKKRKNILDLYNSTHRIKNLTYFWTAI